MRECEHACGTMVPEGDRFCSDACALCELGYPPKPCCEECEQAERNYGMGGDEDDRL